MNTNDSMNAPLITDDMVDAALTRDVMSNELYMPLALYMVNHRDRLQFLRFLSAMVNAAYKGDPSSYRLVVAYSAHEYSSDYPSVICLRVFWVWSSGQPVAPKQH